MLPKKQFSTAVTVYSYHFDKATAEASYVRAVLRSVFWDSESEALKRTGGTSTPGRITLHIPMFYNRGYISNAAFKRLEADKIGGNWTVGLGSDLEASRILPFECGKTFDGMKPAELGREMSEFERGQQGFIYTARTVDEILSCDRQLQRIIVTC